MQGIGNKIAKGAAWMLLFKFLERSLGLISTIILARLLIPADFGLIAMAMSVISILELMSAFSFDIALITNQKAERHHYDTAWTFGLIFRLATSILLLILAIPAAQFYNESRLELVMYFLAIGNFLQGFENIGVVAFRKELTFHKEFKFLLGKKLAGFCVTVPLAFILHNYWALVAGIITGKCAGLIISYVIHPYRPKFSLRAKGELFNFSKWLLINNILNFLRMRSSDFIIGKVLGSHSLGLYNVAFEISTMPSAHLIAPINRAIFPGYAKLSSDLSQFRHGFLNIFSMTLLFSLPIAVGIALTSDYIVLIFLGEKWIEIIPLIQILALWGAIVASQSNTGYVYIALGKPRIVAYMAIFSLSMLLPMLFFSIKNFGIIGAAWSYLIAALVILPISVLVVCYHLEISISAWLSSVWRPLLSVMVMYLSVNAYRYHFVMPDDILLKIFQLLLIVAIGIASYCLTMYLLWHFSKRPKSAEYYILEKISARLTNYSV